MRSVGILLLIGFFSFAMLAAFSAEVRVEVESTQGEHSARTLTTYGIEVK